MDIKEYERKYPNVDFSSAISFECGDGWKLLVDQICDKLNSVAGAEVQQVKEKFGGLRFYVQCSDDTIQDFIAEKERESFTICELCGATESVTTAGSWRKTLCLRCRKQRYNMSL